MEHQISIETCIQIIQEEYAHAQNDWYIGYSGGKDSSALLVLVLNALRFEPINNNCSVHVVYCDTGVEFPMISGFVHKTFDDVESELRTNKMSNIRFQIVQPSVEKRFFSVVIGKGYVTPTFRFRWCTSRLRTGPMQQILQGSNESTVLLGIRNGESELRDRTIAIHRIDHYYTKQERYPNSKIFCPIIDFDANDVWKVISQFGFPTLLNREKLRSFYSAIGTVFSDNGEYIKDYQRGRFGCWTCTVIDEDKAMMGLIKHGYQELQPLNNFMSWLRAARNDSSMRKENYYTKEPGKGAFTIAARKEILKRLLSAQKETGLGLIDSEQLTYIQLCWEQEEIKNLTPIS